MKTKICLECKIEKDIDNFWKHNDRPDGLNERCKECLKSPSAKQKALVLKGFKICTKCKKELPLSYFGLDNTVKDKHCSACKSCKKIYDRKYKQTHKRKLKKYRKERYLKNRNKLLKLNNNYVKLRKQTDVNFKLRKLLSSTLHSALKENWKSGYTINLLGCSIEHFRKHIEIQFQKEMSWENHGRGWNNKKEWHIDHIRPCASFDLSKETEQIKCFHYTNLQPLWAKDNLKKGDRT